MTVDHNNTPQAIELLIREVRELKQIIEEHQKAKPINPLERITRKQLKEEYKIGYATIHNLMRKGRLPYDKVGRKTLFKRVDVEDCINNKS